MRWSKNKKLRVARLSGWSREMLRESGCRGDGIPCFGPGPGVRSLMNIRTFDAMKRLSIQQSHRALLTVHHLGAHRDHTQAWSESNKKQPCVDLASPNDRWGFICGST